MFPQYENDEISDILNMADSIKRFLQDLENLALRKISRGERIPYYAIKESTGRSYWKDGIEDSLIKLLGEKAYNKTIIPITQAKKYLGYKAVDELTYKKSFGPKVVRTKTKDNEVSTNQDMFDD